MIETLRDPLEVQRIHLSCQRLYYKIQNPAKNCLANFYYLLFLNCFSQLPWKLWKHIDPHLSIRIMQVNDEQFRVQEYLKLRPKFTLWATIYHLVEASNIAFYLTCLVLTNYTLDDKFFKYGARYVGCLVSTSECQEEILTTIFKTEVEYLSNDIFSCR